MGQVTDHSPTDCRCIRWVFISIVYGAVGTIREEQEATESLQKKLLSTLGEDEGDRHNA